MKPVDVNIDNYHETVRLFHQENDRSAAVLAGSFIENYLAKFIKHYMNESAPIDELFDGFGPLADYSQRRHIAYAFKLITKKEFDDLGFILKIRNKFAHHPLETKFESEPIKNWCMSLSTKDSVINFHNDCTENEKYRLMFLIAISNTIVGLHNRVHQQNA